MAALIKGFRVRSHTPDPAATHFYDEVDRLHQKNGVHSCGPFYINKFSGLLVYITMSGSHNIGTRQLK